MMEKIKIVAISGSTRSTSSNLNLIKAIAKLACETFSITILEGLSELPHFNPDLDNANVSEIVMNFRKQLREANGILICTPEYAYGVPGTLKNALDWTVSSMEFSEKPVGLITASLSGEKAHQSLLGTIILLGAKMTSETQLLVSFIKSKVSDDFKIIDNATLNSVLRLIQSLTETITRENTDLLSAPSLE